MGKHLQQSAEDPWDILLSDPRSDILLATLIAEARAELHAGAAMDLDDFLAEEDWKDPDEA